ncbi:RmlC-like cupins superfamily protein [Euphorbia peplus]|nr:RmlC-like cupins superfamily protein [Euphorbia peplus]
MAPIFLLFLSSICGGVLGSSIESCGLSPEMDKINMELSPKLAQVAFDGEGGSYSVWTSSEFAQTNVGAGKLVLHPHGFALPHYADSSKIGFVLQGTEGLVGVVFPNSSKEVVLNLKKGDIIPVPLGSASWWFNNGDSDLSIVFLGETSKAYVPGQFTYFLLAGIQGNLAGFSSNFISRAYNLSEEDAIKLATSQTASLIIKLDSGISMPNPDIDLVRKYVYSVQNAEAEVKVKNGGMMKSVSEDKFPFIREVGLSVRHVKLHENAMFSPSYTANGDAKLVYVVKGSGDVEIVGINGMQVLNAKLQSGHLFLVPRFFSFGLIAGDYGLQFLSLSTSSRPVIEDLATKESVWNAISPIVSQISLNITPQLEQLFKSNMNSIIIPPIKH